MILLPSFFFLDLLLKRLSTPLPGGEGFRYNFILRPAPADNQESRVEQAEPILVVENITKRYPGVVALSEVSLEVAPGSLHAVVGENGAGKSTLMKILSGVIVDYEGRMVLRGAPVQYSGTRSAERSGVSIIHQELNLVEELSVAANVFLGREIRGPLGMLNDRAMRDKAGSLLKELHCNIDPAERVGRLRVGDQQLVELAKALSLEADVLLMDEPTSALTESEVERLKKVIARLRKRGVTILYISHKMEEVFELSDRITVLRDGQLVRSLDRDETNPREITHLMVGREIEQVDLGDSRKPGDVVLEIDSLSLPWPGHAKAWRLKDISLSVRRGEIVGLAGLMGAGRTELLECLFGCSPYPPEGNVLLDGTPVKFAHPAEAIRAGMALVTEDRKRLGLFAEMSVGENISVCRLRQATTMGLLSRSRERAMCEDQVEQLSIRTAGVEPLITSLSGGNQQKCIIGRWLLTDPKVLLLDDPTRGVDVGAKAELYALIDRLCRDGLGVLVTSSELPELLTLCDRILVLSEGELTGEFSREEATEQLIMEAATRQHAPQA
ncbi:MAG: sugar ABC transporter ATP-binding protein [Planctomycetales bacterium]